MSRQRFAASVLVDVHDAVDDLARKLPSLGKPDSVISDFDSLREALHAMGAKVTSRQLKDLVESMMPGVTHFDRSAVVDLFCAAKTQMVDTCVRTGAKSLTSPLDDKEIIHTGGTGNEGTKHSVGASERRGYADWINRILKADNDLRHLLPLNANSDELYERVKDGLILCKLINASAPGTVHEKAMNKIDRLNGGAAAYRMQENRVLAVNSAESIGCCIVNIGAEDIANGTRHIVLGLIWQIIRIGLMKHITLAQHKELAALLLPNETLEDLRQLTPEELLLRWVNHHLERAGVSRRLQNFKDDVMDSEAYAHLLGQIAPSHRRPGMLTANEIMQLNDRLERAKLIMDNADKLDAAAFVLPEDIAFANESGRNREKLNMAFVANLFNNYPALEPVDVEVDVAEETLEERTFRNWMNSLGVEPFVKDLYSDLRNGLVLLQLMDYIRRGVVPWKKVYKAFSYNKRIFQWQANCNYVMECGRAIGLPLPSIGAEDVRNGDRKLTLGLVFQMMRAYTMGLLAKLAGGGDKIDDDEILKWANDKLRMAGKKTSVRSFKDPSIADGIVLLDLIDAIQPGKVNVKAAEEATDLLDRASYILSASRMIGGRIYALPEHLVQVNKNMIVTVFACLMILDLELAETRKE